MSASLSFFLIFCTDVLQVQVASNQLLPSLPQLPVWGRSCNSSLLWKPKTLTNNFWTASIEEHKKQRKVLIVISSLSSLSLPKLPVWERSRNSPFLWKPRSLNKNLSSAPWKVNGRQGKSYFLHLLYLFIFDLPTLLSGVIDYRQSPSAPLTVKYPWMQILRLSVNLDHLDVNIWRFHPISKAALCRQRM